MIEQLKFYHAMLRLMPRVGEVAVSSLIRALRRPPTALETSCKPIVLMHGIAGFREIDPFGWNVLEYFTGVRQFLGAMGYQVFAPEVSPFEDPLDRAGQWMSAIDEILEKTGADKVHLIGHSQGGLDARVLVAPPPSGPPVITPLGRLHGLGYGPKVASLTTISTPHFGSAIADEFESGEPVYEEAFERLFNLVSIIARASTGKQQDVKRAVRSLSHRYINDYFNEIIEDNPNVPCYAIAGDPNHVDVVHRILRPTYMALNAIDPSDGGGPNDSLVTVASSFFGNLPPAYEHLGGPHIASKRRTHWQPIGAIEADHIAQVGIQLRLPKYRPYDHLAFFAGLAQRLDDGYTPTMKLTRDGRWTRRSPKSASAQLSVAAVGRS